MKYLWAIANTKPIRTTPVALEKFLLYTVWPIAIKITNEAFVDEFFYSPHYQYTNPSIDIVFPLSNNIKIQQAFNNKIRTILSDHRVKRRIKSSHYYIKDMSRYIKSHGGPIGWKYCHTYWYHISLAALNFLQRNGSFQKSRNRILFSMAMADTILETITINLDMKMSILNKGFEILTSSLRKKYQIENEILNEACKNKIDNLIPIARLKKRPFVSLEFISEHPYRTIINQIKKELSPIGKVLTKSRMKLEKYCRFEDIIYRRLTHPVFTKLGYSNTEELLISYSLYNVYRKIKSN